MLQKGTGPFKARGPVPFCNIPRDQSARNSNNQDEHQQSAGVDLNVGQRPKLAVERPAAHRLGDVLGPVGPANNQGASHLADRAIGVQVIALRKPRTRRAIRRRLNSSNRRNK